LRWKRRRRKTRWEGEGTYAKNCIQCSEKNANISNKNNNECSMVEKTKL
jgi:hypothetical protein